MIFTRQIFLLAMCFAAFLCGGAQAALPPQTNNINPVPHSLVAHWTFDEFNGTNVADLSGNGNVGIFLTSRRTDDSQWWSGRIRGGLRFNSNGRSNEVVLVPDIPMLNFDNRAAFTLSLWVRGEGVQMESAGILCKGIGAGGEQFTIDLSGGKYRFFVRPTTGNPVGTAFTKITPNGKWQHLLATYDSKAGKLFFYINGVQAGTGNAPPMLFRTAHPISIGGREETIRSGYNFYFRGMIDDVRIYNFALNPLEVKSLYESAGNLPPMIYAQPHNENLNAGESCILYAAVDGAEPLRYQWQKEGVDIKGETNISLKIGEAKLSHAGGYVLKISNRFGSVVSATAEVTIVPFFWQTWWFLLTSLFAILFSIGGIFHLIERGKASKALEQLERIHAVDRERMRIAQDMHDEIGGKLSRISFLSDMARRGLPGDTTVGRQIDEVSESAREVIHAVDEIVWTVNPRNDTLESLTHYICRHAEDFFELTAVELEIELPATFPAQHLSAESRHNLFCAAKEALNNVLKHAAATKVRVMFVVTASTFQISIKDDGRGFQLPGELPAAITSAHTKTPVKRSGIINIQERLKNIHGQGTLESQPGIGTTITLTIPLETNLDVTGK